MVPFKMLLNPFLPTKVSFFAWEIWWGKILTSDQLKKRGFSFASLFPLCGKTEESIEHLCLLCPKIRSLWNGLFSFSVKGVFCSLSVQDLMMGWFHLSLGKQEAKV